MPPGTRLVAPPLAGSLRSHGSELIVSDSPRTSHPWARASHATRLGTSPRALGAMPSCVTPPVLTRSSRLLHCASHYALAAARAVPSLPRAKPPAPCAAPRCAQCYASCLKSVLLRCGFPAAPRQTALRPRKAQGKPVRPARSSRYALHSVPPCSLCLVARHAVLSARSVTLIALAPLAAIIAPSLPRAS